MTAFDFDVCHTIPCDCYEVKYIFFKKFLKHVPAARHHMPWGGQALMLKKKEERKSQTCTDKPTDTRLVRDAPNLTAALAMEASHWVTGVNYSLGGQGKSHQNISSQVDHFSAVLTFSIWEWGKKSQTPQAP